MNSLTPSFLLILNIAFTGSNLAHAGNAPCSDTYEQTLVALQAVDSSTDCTNGAFECEGQNALVRIGTLLNFTTEELKETAKIAKNLYSEDKAIVMGTSSVEYHRQTSRNAFAAAAAGLYCAIDRDSVTMLWAAETYACENFGTSRIEGGCSRLK